MVLVELKNQENGAMLPVELKNQENEAMLPVELKNQENGAMLPVELKNQENEAMLPVELKNQENGAMLPVELKIVKILEDKLLSIRQTSQNDSLCIENGRNELLKQIQRFTEQNEPIQFILPGFPFKSPNLEKVTGKLPDGADLYALEDLNGLCREISLTYGHGCKMLIWSDGRVFSDLVGVSNEDVSTYNDILKSYSSTMAHIQWDDMSNYISNENADDLIKMYGTKTFTFEHWLSTSENNHKEYIHLRTFLERDLGNTGAYKELSRRKLKGQISHIAREMIRRNDALTNLLKQHHPNHIRLSVHQHPYDGKKFSVRFFIDASIESTTCALRTPWHNVLVFSVDGRQSLIPLTKLKLQSEYIPLMFQDQLWCFFQLPPSSSTLLGPILKLSVLGKSPKFGISIDLDKKIDVSQLDIAWMKMLLNRFGVVVIRQCKTSLNKENYSYFCEQFGPPVIWNFGSLLVLKPVVTPESGHASRESMPLHFDLCYPPDYLVKTGLYNDYVPQYFMLYCVKAPPECGGGKTNFVNGRLLLESIEDTEILRWKTMNIASSTPKSYFGGKSFTYPMIMSHPKTNENVLRYLETSDTTYQPVENTCSTDNDINDVETFDEFNKKMKEKMRDQKWYMEYTWHDDDIVIVENHILLHGRTAISEESERELWRIQIY